MKNAKETYQVQVRIGDLFEDLLIKATSEEAALRQARTLTTLKGHRNFRWANFVL